MEEEKPTNALRHASYLKHRHPSSSAVSHPKKTEHLRVYDFLHVEPLLQIAATDQSAQNAIDEFTSWTHMVNYIIPDETATISSTLA